MCHRWTHVIKVTTDNRRLMNTHGAEDKLNTGGDLFPLHKKSLYFFLYL